MEFITNWVTQIIIFLILATIIDLLIPANTMKKYIKLVIGLILMLIFLKPIFYLFNIDVQQALESSFTQLYQEETTADSLENLIEMEKIDIQASQDAYILEQMTFQLIDLAKEPLVENHQLEIAHIDFQFSDEQDLTYENLDEVIVHLRESGNEEGNIDVVDEVIIGESIQPKKEIEKQHHEDIKLLLQDVWEISNKKLTIKTGGGVS